MLEAAGFQKIVYEDFYEYFITIIRQITTPNPQNGRVIGLQNLLECFQSAESTFVLFIQDAVLNERLQSPIRSLYIFDSLHQRKFVPTPIHMRLFFSTLN